MEENSEKVVGSQVVVDLKRKQPSCGETLTSATQVVLPLRSTTHTSVDISGKRGKLHCSRAKCGSCFSHFSKPSLENYLNLKKTALPQRLMYYQDGTWTEYPKDFVAMVKDEFMVKKTFTEMEFSGTTIVFDFLHMVQVDMQTGLQQPIAWIDETGNCFFPETFAEFLEQNKDGEGHCEQVSGSQDSVDIKLQLEIDNGFDFSNLKAPSRDSICAYKKHPSIIAIGDDKANKAFCENQRVKLPGGGALEKYTVREFFMMGMRADINVDVVEISRGTAMLARLELFLKQAEIIEKSRGEANIRFGWLPCCKGELQGIMMFGLGVIGATKVRPAFGAGVHLFPANCSHISASYCDPDDTGARHMVFCRVVLGKMEVVHQGSKQFHPSSEGFDSGVDNLQDPGHYVVWNMNVATHIFPEYVVTFRGLSDTEGPC